MQAHTRGVNISALLQRLPHVVFRMMVIITKMKSQQLRYLTYNDRDIY